MIFQIHVPLWDMTHFFKTPFSIFHKFQSTRPCGTRQIPKSELEIVREISIHAPLWDATPTANPLAVARTISIHAPLWDAT